MNNRSQHPNTHAARRPSPRPKETQGKPIVSHPRQQFVTESLKKEFALFPPNMRTQFMRSVLSNSPSTRHQKRIARKAFRKGVDNRNEALVAESQFRRSMMTKEEKAFRRAILRSQTGIFHLKTTPKEA